MTDREQDKLPETGSNPLRTAWSRYQAGQLDDVVTFLRDEIASTTEQDLASSDHVQLLELLGLALHDLGRPLEAVDAIEQASIIAPIRDETRIALASCYAELRRTDLARDLFLELALSRRLSPALMLQVAAGLEAIDAPQMAMQVCEWITEQDDSIAQAYYDMGFYSARSGQPLYLTEALTHRALQLDPANIHYRIGLVSLMVQLGRDDEAVVALGSIDESKIELVTCVGCLLRIAAMLDRKGRESLANVCRTRADSLRGSDAPTGGLLFSSTFWPDAALSEQEKGQ